MAGEKIKEEVFLAALKGKKIPIVTLDNKWYRLFEALSEEEELGSLEKRLNDLLKRQGKMNTETRDIKKLKKKLMAEIVPMVDELEQENNKEVEKKIEKNKQLIQECNEKLEEYQNDLLEIPAQIDEANFDLMIATMHYCYEKMQSNTGEIQEITEWVDRIRVELKKNLIRKQDREIRNHNIYSYMHDIFGADVIDLFDMKYNPGEQHPRKASEKETEEAQE